MKDLGFNIGDVRLANPLVLAPMAGVTNLPFRYVAKKEGAALTVTEMVSAVGLSRLGAKTMKLMATFPEERPLAVQLFGYRTEALTEAAVLAVENGADIIDFNLGCPARKVVRHGSGSALLRDFKKIAEILPAIRKVCRVPFTVKTRAGWQPGEGEVLDLVPILIDSGVDAVTLHARYAVQRFGGRADWDLIARLAERFPGPVIGNGDVMKPEDAAAMMEYTGCAGVMIGRGALGNPWIFSQALALLEGRPAVGPDLDQRFLVAESHARMLKDHVGEKAATYMLRSVLMWYTKGLPDSATFRRSINQESDFPKLLYLLGEYFSGLSDRETREAAAG